MNPNDHMRRAMRYCDACGVGMGIMTRKEYVEQFINHPGLCPTCGKKAYEVERVEEAWLTTAAAHTRYNISLGMLSKMIRAGEIAWRPGNHYIRGRQVRERDMVKFGMREVSNV